jgi:hypothetical protein
LEQGQIFNGNYLNSLHLMHLCLACQLQHCV